MDATITWKKDLNFVGIADSGYPVLMDSRSSPESGAGPVELTLMALAGCTAMDVISILKKKRERIHAFEVLAHAERAADSPRVITAARLEYVVSGRRVREASLARAIELSVQQYCSVHAMLQRAFPIELSYSIYEQTGEDRKEAVVEGRRLQGFTEP